MTTAEFPTATRDLRAACDDLDRFGFCVVDSVLDRDGVEAVRDRLLAQAREERELRLDHGYPAEAEGDDVNQWVYQLLNKGEIFRTLPVHPTASALATHLLGDRYLLSSIDAHITYPGNMAMPLHADQWWMPPPMTPGDDHVRQGDISRGDGPFGSPEPAPHPITGPLILNVMWMITDFVAANGATRVVPRSHLSGNVPTPGQHYDEIPVEGSAGSVLAWDGRTWHGAGLNTSDGPRVGLTTYFCGPMIRQLENNVYGTRSEVRDQLSDTYLDLLGFKPWSSYGMTDDPDCDVVRPGNETAGELGQ